MEPVRELIVILCNRVVILFLERKIHELKNTEFALVKTKS